MKAISIQDLNKFRWVCHRGTKPPEMVPAFRTGYWNVFDHSPELESFLVEHGVRFHVYEDKWELLPARRTVRGPA